MPATPHRTRGSRVQGYLVVPLDRGQRRPATLAASHAAEGHHSRHARRKATTRGSCHAQPSGPIPIQGQLRVGVATAGQGALTHTGDQGAALVPRVHVAIKLPAE